MEIRSPSPRKKPAFLRKSSIYDDTPLSGRQKCDLIVRNLKKKNIYQWLYMYVYFKCLQGSYLFFFYVDKATPRPSSVVGELKKEDDQLSEMLNTLMGEAKQIRGENSYTTTV